MVGIRPKLLLVILVLGFVPMLVLGVLLYRVGVTSVESDLRTSVAHDGSGIVLKIEAALRKDEALLSELARSQGLRVYLNGVGGLAIRNDAIKTEGEDATVGDGVTKRVIPVEVMESVRSFLLNNRNRYSSITCLSASRSPLFRAETVFRNDSVSSKPARFEVDFKTEDFLVSQASVDARVWNTSELSPIRSSMTREAKGAILRYSVPVFAADAVAEAPRGVLIAELNGDSLFDDAMTGSIIDRLDIPDDIVSTSPRHFIVVLDHDGSILFDTNEALRHQKVDSVLPYFKDISNAMIAGESGWKFYDQKETRWLATYRPIPILGTSLCVAGDYTQATAGLTRIGWISFVLFSLFGLVTMVVLAHILRNTARSIERVTEGAVAIAGGKLEQRIEVRSNDETRLLAESFNIMTDRVREQIAHETESRQFESFMRLSAMMTHDLKNAIAGLSLLVGNMARQFHREEFRADAMKSLTQATDKLRGLVAKLSEPVQSLSSEHQMARPIDLVPMIRKALDTTVEPASELLEIEVDLPKNLIATVEADRIEKVFENLILNALEAMATKGGKLTIQAGQTQQGEVFFSVSDTGPGMSEEFQRIKLFRAFATTKKTGIGLGLYACREIVQAHGGRIEVKSKRGSGATFRVVLPSESKIAQSTDK